MISIFLLCLQKINLPNFFSEMTRKLPADEQIHFTKNLGKSLIIFHNIPKATLSILEVTGGHSQSIQTYSEDKFPHFVVLENNQEILIVAKPEAKLTYSFIPLGYNCQKRIYINNNPNAKVKFDKSKLDNDRCFIFAPFGSKQVNVSTDIHNNELFFAFEPSFELSSAKRTIIPRKGLFEAKAFKCPIFQYRTPGAHDTSTLEFTVKANETIEAQTFEEYIEIAPPKAPTPPPTQSLGTLIDDTNTIDEERKSYYIIILGVAIVSGFAYAVTKYLKHRREPNDATNLIDDNIMDGAMIEDALKVDDSQDDIPINIDDNKETL